MNTCSKRRICYEGNGVNRLSTLPDLVLVRILSLLPARDAARTVLLRTFGHLWKNIDTLDFDDSPFQKENVDTENESAVGLKFIVFVRNFLLLHRGPKIREFRLKLSYPLEVVAGAYSDISYDKVMLNLENEIKMFTKVALDRGVEVFDLGMGMLDIFYYGKCYFNLPRCVWTNETLVELSLFCCAVELPKQVQMGSLRVLKLSAVSFSKEMLKQITCNCHMLQDLTIIDCVELDEISFSAPNIETLHVSVPHADWDVIINCPNVKYFNFSGLVNDVKLVDLSSLKTVSLCLVIDLFLEFKEFHKLKRLLERIQNAEVVKLNKEAFAVLTYRVVKNHPFPCNKWKSVKLDTWLNDKYISGIHSLLRYSSHLEELIMDIKDLPEDLPEDVHYELHDSEYVGVNKRSSEWLIHDLKKVTMIGIFKSSFAAQVDLIKVILKNALVLGEFIIFAKGSVQPPDEDEFTFEDLFNISQELLTFPRASKQAMVFFK